jgi:hypothetical protein
VKTGMRRVRFGLAGTAFVVLTFLWSPGGVVAAGETPPAVAIPDAGGSREPPPKKEETPADRIDRELKSVQDRLREVTQQEIELAMELVATQQRANELKGNARKAVLVQIAERTRGVAANYARLVKNLKPLETDRPQATPEQQKRIDELANRIYAKHKAQTDKVANMFEQAGEFKAVYDLWADYYQSLPESRRDRGLKEKLAREAERCGDLRGAVRWWKSIFEAAPPKDRFRDRGAGEKLGDLLVRTGDFTSALGLYKDLLEAIAPEKRDSDGKSLKDKIKVLEAKLGRAAPPPPPKPAPKK